MENIVTVTLPSIYISMIVSLKWSNSKTTRQLQFKQRKTIILNSSNKGGIVVVDNSKYLNAALLEGLLLKICQIN